MWLHLTLVFLHKGAQGSGHNIKGNNLAHIHLLTEHTTLVADIEQTHLATTIKIKFLAMAHLTSSDPAFHMAKSLSSAP
ncbi:hypothetical protein GALMADRAFT_241972 [Galerina marginata CBS 339.88]|uniref:Secreted protein n=1 Tax=Galerina marginata (strain CBS 339.88) TaxID=685588 RepID=A0A067TBZ1_GALM3|nr:hypothetical protein GALMADRAFT_241972 [Galerina marginata CBS 339.88]